MRVETAAGAVINLGTTETAPTISITDFSRRVTDDFGVTTVVKRGFARRMSVRLSLPFDNVDAVQRQLAELRASSALWVADDRYAWLKVNGFYKDFDLDLAVPPVSFCRLTVEGLAEAEVVADPGGDPAPTGQVSTLRLVQPSEGNVLVSSNVPEADHPEWAAGTSYGPQARVIKTTTHRIYESVAGSNLGNDPATSFDKWIDIGPTNRWAMFDQALGSFTAANAAIIVELTAATAVALLDVTAATVRLQATGYDQTQAVTGGAIVFLDLPAAGGQITITVAGPGQVSVGTLIAGTIRQLGVTEAAPTAGITDFSRKQTDDFGEVTVVQRAWAKRMTARALIRTEDIDRVANRIAAVRARPSLWIGQAGLDSVTVYGFFKEFSIEVGETVSKLSLTIEGLSKAPPIAPAEAIAWENILGRPPGLITITANAQAFNFVDNVATDAGQLIMLTASRQDASEAIVWSVTPVVTLGTTANPLQRSVSITDFGNHRQITVTATGALTGVKDTMTLVRLDRSTAAANAGTALPLTQYGTGSFDRQGNSISKLDNDAAWTGGFSSAAYLGNVFIEARFAGLVAGTKFAELALDNVDPVPTPSQTPSNSGAPVITGLTTEGSVLSVTAGTWTNVDPENTVTPVISGTAQENSILSVSTGTWSNA